MNPSDSSDDCEFATSRLVQAPPGQVFDAIKDPGLLAQWWGPKGFRNTFHEFEFKPGGNWRFDMHGPGGTDYPNHCVFQDVSPDRVVIRHVGPVHAFTLTIGLMPAADGATKLTWNQKFDSAEECERVRAYVPRCNEENLDRLEGVLAAMTNDGSAD